MSAVRDLTTRCHPSASRPPFVPGTPWRATASSIVELLRRSSRAGLVMWVVAASAVQPAAQAQAEPVQSGRPAEAVPMANRWAAFIHEASRRFGVPEDWIQAVINVESGGNPTVVSSAGAMGLMQLMAQTWWELRHRHGLGQDAFDPRDNILAGTAYLRELYDRYGAPGFLAAYHAGPGRYNDHLTSGRALPFETQAYLTILRPALGTTRSQTAGPMVDPTRSWAQSPLFVAPVARAPAVSHTSSQLPAPTSVAVSRAVEGPLFQPAGESLFVHRSAAAPLDALAGPTRLSVDQ
jgi:hypothetical protein